MSEQTKEEIRKELESFGFQKKYIDQAIQLTNDKEQAVQLVIQMLEDDEKSQKQPPQLQQFPQQDLFNIDFSKFQLPNFNLPQVQKRFKMVFLVRQDLKMGIGKIAAQTGHATLGAYKSMLQKAKHSREAQETLDQWEYGQAKIVLKVESKEEFLEYEKKAREAGLNTYIVRDAGHTQVDPGSMTVAAIGPAESDLIDSITGDLKLL